MVLFIDFDSMEFACKDFGWYNLFDGSFHELIFYLIPPYAGLIFVLSDGVSTDRNVMFREDTNHGVDL